MAARAANAGVFGGVFAVGVAAFTASSNCTASTSTAEDTSPYPNSNSNSNADSNSNTSSSSLKTNGASLGASTQHAVRISNPAGGSTAPAAGTGWWAKLRGSSGSSLPGDSQSKPTQSKETAGASTIPKQENEGWWAWASERLAGRPPPSPPVEVPLPLDKLSCKMPKDGQKRERPAVVLLSCGSFNPPTIAHLRMFELAYDALTEQGYDVLGGYMSPVNDAYGKPDLAQSKHRVRMVELAAESSSIIMVDSWEAVQPAWQRSLSVMKRLRDSLAAELAPRQSASLPMPRAAVPGSRSESRAASDSMTADAADFPGSQGVSSATGAFPPGSAEDAAAEATAELPTVGSFTRHSAHAAWASPHAAPSAGTAGTAGTGGTAGTAPATGSAPASVSARQGRDAHATRLTDNGTLPKGGTLVHDRTFIKGSSSARAAASSSVKGGIAHTSGFPISANPAGAASEAEKPAIQAVPRVLLLCGADLVESFITPGVWRSDHLREIVGPEFGVVCIARRGSDVRRMLTDNSTDVVLARGITIVEDPVSWDVSSTRVRSLLQQDKSIKYLVPDGVLDYVKLHALYGPPKD